MSKGDWVKVRSEIGGALQEDTVIVTQNGGSIEVVQKPREGLVYVHLFNRVGKPVEKHTYVLSALRSISEKRRDDA